MAETGSWTSPGGLRLSWACTTHVGKVRKVNEDSLLARPGAFVVADGMGGHRAGDVASRLAIAAVERLLSDDPISVDVLPALVREANEIVRAEARLSDHLGMGSTLVGLFVVDNGGDEELAVVNVGDSRCYRVEDGRLHQITRDHSHVQDLVEAGAITAEQAHSHPERNVITRAIGAEAVVAGDYYFLTRLAESRLLLCSDGLLGDVDHAELELILLGSTTPNGAADSLLEAALRGRAADNITLVVVDATVEVPADGAPDESVPDGSTRQFDSDVTLPQRVLAAVHAAEAGEGILSPPVEESTEAAVPAPAAVIASVPLDEASGEIGATAGPAALIDGIPKEFDNA